MNIVILLTLFGIGLLAFYFANKMFGKSGVLAFGVLAVILANYQAAYPTDLFGTGVVTSSGIFVLLFGVLLYTYVRYGRKVAAQYTAVVIGASFIDQISRIFTMLAWGKDVMSVDKMGEMLVTTSRVMIGNIVAIALVFVTAIYLLDYMLKKKKYNTYLTFSIVLVVCLIIDVFMFNSIAFAGTTSAKQFFMDISVSYLVKIIFAAICVGLYALYRVASNAIAPRERLVAVDFKNDQPKVVEIKIKEEDKQTPVATAPRITREPIKKVATKTATTKTATTKKASTTKPAETKEKSKVAAEKKPTEKKTVASATKTTTAKKPAKK